jgi:hypothetical protein
MEMRGRQQQGQNSDNGLTHAEVQLLEEAETDECRQHR